MISMRCNFSFEKFTCLKMISQIHNFHNDSPSYINIDDNNMQNKKIKKRKMYTIFYTSSFDQVYYIPFSINRLNFTKDTNATKYNTSIFGIITSYD